MSTQNGEGGPRSIPNWDHETGSITAKRLEITEDAARVHVWTSNAPEDSIELTYSDKRWTMHELCPVHFIAKSATGKCWNCEEE